MTLKFLRINITDEEKIYYLDRFENILGRFVESGNFMSYRSVKHFDEEFWKYMDLIEELIEIGNAEFTAELVESIKERLASVDTDDDFFQEYEIKVIDDILEIGGS